MPTISRFFGIIIAMYHNDHAPPHFHVLYGGVEAEVDIESLEVLQGRLPPRVLGMALEWASRHQDELRLNWRLAREQLPLKRIEPLS